MKPHVRWLSWRTILTRFFELRTEIEVFLREKKSLLFIHFQDIIWLTKVVYLSDIFSLLNELNLSMQRPLTNILHVVIEILTTIKTKLRNKLDVEPTMRISLTNSIEEL
jgi:hypothetical protein